LKYHQILNSNFSIKLSILKNSLTKFSTKHLSNSLGSIASSNFSSNKNSEDYSTQKDSSVYPSYLESNSPKQSVSTSSSLMKFSLSPISSKLTKNDFIIRNSIPTSVISFFYNIVSKKIQFPVISFNSHSFEISIHSSKELLLDISPIPFEDFIFSITISFLLSNSSVDSFTNSSIQILKKCLSVLLSFPIIFENVQRIRVDISDSEANIPQNSSSISESSISSSSSSKYVPFFKLKEFHSELIDKDFILTEKYLIKFSFLYSSRNDKKVLSNILFLNNYQFQFQFVHYNQIQVQTTDSPKEDFFITICRSLLINDFSIKSFREQIQFEKGNSLTLLEFSIVPFDISKILIEISNFIPNQVFNMNETSSLQKSDFDVQDELPTIFACFFSSKDSTGKFPQTLFINNFLFQISVFDKNSIQVFTTDSSTQDFCISISNSFSFFKTNNIKSFQTRTQFSKDNPMIF
jgi:hypothetical protein